MNTNRVVMKFAEKYLDMFLTDRAWQEEMEKDIQSQSNGKIRAFHLFFNSVQECVSGYFQAQALTEQDVINMYPILYEKAVNCPVGKFLYIFHCNDAISPGHGVTSDTMI